MISGENLMTIELELGAFYKETREKLGYSQRDAESAYCDHSLISRFENGETVLRADKLLMAINGLDLTPTEFFVWHGEYLPNRLQIFNKKMSAYAINEDVDGLKTLLKTRAIRNEDKIFNILVKCAIFDLSDEMLIIKSERKFIEKHFNNVKQWTIYEMSVFAHCLEAIDDAEVYDIGQDILKSDEFSKIIDSNATLAKKTLVNLYVHLICHGSYRYAEKLKQGINDLLTEWDMSEKIILHIFEKFSLYRQEKSPELLAEIQDDLQILNRFGATGMAKRMTLFIKKYCE
jgi:Rgg/GadR/MutR family transcriptional activator|uniref:helix-turn-helix domain-containing protein n=1 Tax=Lactococcus sp. TaxID=44273 RepID=UPI0032424903